MSGNDEQPNRLYQQKQEYERLAELRKEEARAWIPHIMEIVNYARRIAGNERLRRVKFNRLIVEQIYDIQTDPYTFNMVHRPTQRHRVYIRNGIFPLRESFVMDFDEREIYRFIPGPWTTWIRDYKIMARQTYERRLGESHQRKNDERIREIEERIRELKNNFSLGR